MHTLSQLKSGELTGIQRLKISDKLTSFPLEILSLADSLEILDLSDNQLTSLPSELSQLKKLKMRSIFRLYAAILRVKWAF